MVSIRTLAFSIAALGLCPDSTDGGVITFADTFDDGAAAVNTGWTPNFSADAYVFGNTLGAPTGAGSHYWQNTAGDSFQDFALTPDISAAEIDAGLASYQFEAQLGSFTLNPDRAQVRLTWLDVGTNQIGGNAELFDGSTVATNGVWQPFSGSGLVPANARFARIFLEDSAIAGQVGSNDGYVDLLSLTVSSVPEPSAAMLMIVGLSVIAFRADIRRTTRKGTSLSLQDNNAVNRWGADSPPDYFDTPS